MAAHSTFWVAGEIRTPLHESWRFLFSNRWIWSIVHSLRRRNNKSKAKWPTTKKSETRQSGLHQKSRLQLPEIFEKQSERCPVKLFHKYLSKRPVEMEKSGPFYLQPIVNPLINIWYKKTPMGINSINSILMIMATRCSKNNCPILLTTISWLHPKINISSLQITQ